MVVDGAALRAAARAAEEVTGGHPDGVAFWSRFADALQAAGYDGPLSIENEDYALGQRESVALAVDTLRQALAARTAVR